jgi:hypothetical protein
MGIASGSEEPFRFSGLPRSRFNLVDGQRCVVLSWVGKECARGLRIPLMICSAAG